MRRLGLGLAVAIATIVLAAAPASAHADLEANEPASGAVLDQPPATVKLLFTEGVDVSLGSVRVFDGNGEALAAGQPEQPDSRSVSVPLPTDLGQGTYVVTWRVVSGDSHPIHGAFTFIVGTGPAVAGAPPAAGDPLTAGPPHAMGDTQALARGLVEADSGSSEVGIILGLVRFASYASLIVLIGGFAFLLVVWPAGKSLAAVRRLLGAAWLLSIVLTIAGIALQGVYAAGLPLADVLRWSVTEGVLDTKFGQAWLARLVLLVVAGPLLLRVVRRNRAVPALMSAVLAAIGAAVLATGGIAGHPGTDHPAALTVGADAAHFAAVSFWLGGLVLLCLVVLRRNEPDGAVEAVSRFSPLAFAAVVMIVVTGTFQGWWQVRSLDAVTGTTYGRLLLAKVGTLTAILGLAYLSRAWVRSRVAEPERVLVGAGPGAMKASTPGIGSLRRSVAAEALLAVAVLVITAVLVNTVPGRTAVKATDAVDARDAFTGPFSTQLHTAKVRIDVGFDPATVGPNEIHIYTLTHGGDAADVEELRARMTLPAKNVGPLELPLQRVGPGHLAAYTFVVPFPGTWLLEVTARTSDIDQSTATTPIQIR